MFAVSLTAAGETEAQSRQTTKQRGRDSRVEERRDSGGPEEAGWTGGKVRARRPSGLTWSSQNQEGGQDPEAGCPQQGGSRGNRHGAPTGVPGSPAGRPRFYPGRRNAVGPVPRVSGGRSQGGVGLRGGNKPLRGLGGGLPAGPSTWGLHRGSAGARLGLDIHWGVGQRKAPPSLKGTLFRRRVGKGGTGPRRPGSWVWAVGKAPGPPGGGGWRGAARGSLTGPVTQRETWPSLGLRIPLTHFPKARESGPQEPPVPGPPSCGPCHWAAEDSSHLDVRDARAGQPAVQVAETDVAACGGLGGPTPRPWSPRTTPPHSSLGVRGLLTSA